MKVILSITSIPARFQYLKPLVQHLKEIKGCDEVWVNISKNITGFQIGMVSFPYESFGENTVINRDCEILDRVHSFMVQLVKRTLKFCM